MAEKKRYYHTAYASCQECKTILKLAKCTDENTIDTADKLGAWLYKLLKSEIQESKIYGSSRLMVGDSALKVNEA